MPTPSIDISSRNKASYDRLSPKYRPIVDEAYGIFADFIRTNDLESLESRIFPVCREYDRLLAPLNSSTPDLYYPLRNCFGVGLCGLYGVEAWIFDAYMSCGERDKAWDFLRKRYDNEYSDRRFWSASEIVNLRLLSPRRSIRVEELAYAYLTPKEVASADQREAIEHAANELITQFERASGFSFAGYFFTRWLLRDAYVYESFAETIRADAAKTRSRKPAELAKVDLRELMNVSLETIVPFSRALSKGKKGTPFPWYSCPEFDTVFSIIIRSLMNLAAHSLTPEGGGADFLSFYPGLFDFEDKRAYSWTEEEILSEVSSYATRRNYRTKEIISAALRNPVKEGDFAQSEKEDMLKRLIDAKNARALSNLLSTGSVNTIDEYSVLFAYASKVGAGVEIQSVILSSQHQFCQAKGISAPGSIPEL